MNMIYCTCNIGVMNELMEIFSRLHIDNYQIIEDVKAKGLKGEPRLNTEVWPGVNAIIITHVDDERSNNLSAAIKEFNGNVVNDDELITFCRYQLDEFIYD